MASSDGESTGIWMPMYIGDYLGSTSRLTTEQHGAYLLLRMDYWKNGPLPNNDAILAQITRLSPDAWSMHRAVLANLFTISNDQWIHESLDSDLLDAKEKRRKAKAKAEAAARARWGKSAHSDSSSACSKHSASTNQGKHEECPSPSSSPSEEKDIPPAAGEVSPPVVSTPSIWNIWEQITGDKKSRAFLGKQIKDYGEQAVRRAVLETLNKQPADPTSYLIGMLQERTHQRQLSVAERIERANPIKKGLSLAERVRIANAGGLD